MYANKSYQIDVDPKDLIGAPEIINPGKYTAPPPSAVMMNR